MIDAALIWRLSHQVLTQVLRDCGADFARLGLEAKEFFVLAELPETSSPAQLAERLAIPKASLTAYVRTLEAAGLARRELDHDDLRRFHIRLTPEGDAIRQQALTILRNTFEQRLSRLQPPEREQLVRLLGGLLDEREN